MRAGESEVCPGAPTLFIVSAAALDVAQGAAARQLPGLVFVFVFSIVPGHRRAAACQMAALYSCSGRSNSRCSFSRSDVEGLDSEVGRYALWSHREQTLRLVGAEEETVIELQPRASDVLTVSALQRLPEVVDSQGRAAVWVSDSAPGSRATHQACACFFQHGQSRPRHAFFQFSCLEALVGCRLALPLCCCRRQAPGTESRRSDI